MNTPNVRYVPTTPIKFNPGDIVKCVDDSDVPKPRDKIYEGALYTVIGHVANCRELLFLAEAYGGVDSGGNKLGYGHSRFELIQRAP